MKRNSLKYLIICFMLIAVVATTISVSLISKNTSILDNQDIAINAAPIATSSASSGDGKKDGGVPNNYLANIDAKVAEYNTAHNLTGDNALVKYEINNQNTLTTFLGSSAKKYGYLSTSFDINVAPLTTASYSIASNAVLDGCGFKIKNTGSTTSSFSGSNTFGGLMSIINGTVKNLEFEFAGYVNNAGSPEGNSQNFGCFSGQLGSSGKMYNCFITININYSSWDKINLGGIGHDKHLAYGGIIGESYGGTIEKTTLNMQSNFSIASYDARSGLNTKKHDTWVGGFIACNNTNAVSLKNCSMIGAGNVTAWGNDNGEGKLDIAAIIGWIEKDNVSIDGFISSWTGAVSSTGKWNNNKVKNLVSDNKTFSLSNFYVKPNTTIASQQSDYSFDCNNDEIGFCYSDNSKIWIGRPSNKSGSGSSIKGSFLSSLQIGEGVAENIEITDVSTDIGTAGYTTSGVVYVASIGSGNIFNLTYGLYTYASENVITNGLSTSQGGHIFTGSGRSFEADYNGNEARGFTAQMVLLNNSIAVSGASAPISGWTCNETIKNVKQNNGTYRITVSSSNIPSNGQLIESNGVKYCVEYASASSYYIDIEIKKAHKRLSDYPQNETFEYTGAGQNIAQIRFNISEAGQANISYEKQTGTSTWTAVSGYPRDLGTYRMKINEEVNTENEIIETGSWVFSITPARLCLILDDTKVLYDSIIDYNSTDNSYDFIYVQNSDYANRFLSSFGTDYINYFKIKKAGSETLENARDYITISTNAVSGTVGNYNISYEIISGTSLYNDRANYNGVKFETTGSGRSELTSNGVVNTENYCEVARTNVNVRIRVVSNVTVNSAWDGDLAYWDNSNNETNSNLYKVMTTRYYDSYGTNTTYNLKDTVYINKPFNASRIMPSYKTINGQSGATVYVKLYTDNNSSTGNSFDYIQVSGATQTSSWTAESDLSGTLTSAAAYRKEYPAYKSINGTEYFGAGLLVGINYGTIKNLFIRTMDVPSGEKANRVYSAQYIGLNGRSSAQGYITGINAGICINNTIRHEKLTTFVSRAGSGNNSAVGFFVGANTGYLSSNTIEEVPEVTHKHGGINEYRYYYTYIRVASYATNNSSYGNPASNIYFGVHSGINTGFIGLDNGVNGTFNYSKTIPVEVNNERGNAYAGLISGYNSGTINKVNCTLMTNRFDNSYSVRQADGTTWSAVSGIYDQGEFTIKASSTAYVGGIAGYNNGAITNSNFTLDYNPSKQKTPYIKALAMYPFVGGIAGFNVGKESSTPAIYSAKIENCVVRNNTGIISGGKSDAAAKYLIGGIAGANSRARIYRCDFFNNSGQGSLYGYSNAAPAGYVGGLIGVGCETGTVANANEGLNLNTYMNYNLNIYPGELILCSALNYSTHQFAYGADNGGWGYLTGKYNNIIGANYTHEYGGLIWYTKTHPSGYPLCLFGGISAVMGNCEGVNDIAEDQYDTYITGIAGIALGDSGDDSYAGPLFDGAELLNGNLYVKYKAIDNSSNIFKGFDAYCGDFLDNNNFAEILNTDGTYKSLSQSYGISGKNVGKTVDYSAGQVRIGQEKVNAEIHNPRAVPTIAKVVLRFYIEINSNDQYVQYVLGGNNNDEKQRFAAGYATIASQWSGELTGAPWSATLNEYKTVDGNNKTIIYHPSSSSTIDNTNEVEAYMSASTNRTLPLYVRGNFIGLNKGVIKNLKISFIADTAQEGTIPHGVVVSSNSEQNAYGIIAAINNGVISNCYISISGGGYVGLAPSSQTGRNYNYSVGAVAGISTGVIRECYINFNNDSTLTLYGDASVGYDIDSYGWLGGIVGLASGELKNCVVIGKGDIKAKNAISNLSSFVGGIAGYAVIKDDNTNGTALGTLSTIKVSVFNSGNLANFMVALNGEIRSASTTKIGGSGYFFGRSICAMDNPSQSDLNTYKNSLHNFISVYPFGAMFFIGRGEPTLLSYDTPRLQNSLFGYCRYLPNVNAWQAIGRGDALLFDTSSYMGFGGFEFFDIIEISVQSPSISANRSYTSWTDTSESNFDIKVNLIPNTVDNNSILSVTSFKTSALNSAIITNDAEVPFKVKITNSQSQNFEYGITEYNNNNNNNNTFNGCNNIYDQTSWGGLNPWIKIKFEYAINIAGNENIVWNDINARDHSPICNFLSGRGSEALYAGAKKGILQGNVTFDKKMNATIIFHEGKIFDGRNKNFYSVFRGDRTNQVAGVSCDSGNSSMGHNNVADDTEYPYNYNYDGDVFYGISDFVSINYGTIRNINVINTYNAEYLTQYYNGLNANASYGTIAGINATSGRIENCKAEINTEAAYAAGANNLKLVLGVVAGINDGEIKNTDSVIGRTGRLTVRTGTTKNTTEFNHTNGYFVLSGMVGINGRNALIYGGTTEIYGTLAVGRASLMNAENNGEKGKAIQGVTVAGLVGINAGGSVQYVKVKGDGRFGINASQIVETYDGDVLVSSRRDYLLTINYLYFAAGIALNNNKKNTTETYQSGFNIYPSVDDSNNNKVHNIIISFSGEISMFATNYMAGIAFAKAADTTSASNNAPAYKDIFWNEDYNLDLELYIINNSYSTNANIEGNITASGFPLMGRVNSEANSSDFMTGSQIYALEEIVLQWNKNGSGDFTGDLLVTTSANTMKSKAPIEELAVKYNVPSADLKDSFLGNFNYYTFTKGEGSEQSSLLLKSGEGGLLTRLYNNIRKDNEEDMRFARLFGKPLRIEIKFSYPYVEINDVYQLVQFMWFTSDDGNRMLDYYLRTYIANIDMLIDNNLKKATSSNPFGAWVKADDPNIIKILSHYKENEYFIYYHNNAYYYLFLEKYYDDDGDELLYYAASSARLGSNIDLMSYGAATPGVGFGFDKTTTKEFAASKSIDGQGHTIVLFAHPSNGQSYTVGIQYKKYNQLPTTSKWYSSSDNYIYEQDLPDKYQMPSKDYSSYIFGGFVGINRGTISNINFIFPENQVLNLTGADRDGNEHGRPAELDMYRNMYFGLIAAYSTGTIDGCSVTFGNNSQIYINKKNERHDNNDNTSSIYMGGITGVLGQYATVSNCSVSLGVNVRFGAQNIGSVSVLSSKGNVRSAVGGFVGQMLAGSELYNALIDGDQSSIIFAFTENSKDGASVYRYSRYVAAAGGLVGINTTDSDWNPFKLGKGTIDGVIFNWSGKSLSCYWSEGWKISGNINLGGDRSKLNTYFIGGNVVGMTGDKEGSVWKNNDSVRNLYYTFNISDFRADYPDDNKIKIKNNAGDEIGLNIAGRSNSNPRQKGGYAVALSDMIAQENNAQGESSLDSVINVLSIYKLPASDNSTNGTGITPVGGTKTYGEKDITTLGYSSITIAESYQKVTTMKNLLSWADRTKSSNVLCRFTADLDTPSSVMWNIAIKGARVDGNFLRSQDNSLIEFPIYRFARSLTEAQEYNTREYSIVRGEGDGMAIYYCTGNAAILSPRKDYYTNQYHTENGEIDPTIFYPLKAVMYDGSTSGETTSINIYDLDGNAITRLGSSAGSIISSAGDDILRRVKALNGSGEYVDVGDNAELKNIGSYKVEFTIKANKMSGSSDYINQNAYVAENQRVLFFNAGGAESTFVDNGANSYYEVETYTIYIVIAPISISLTEVYKVYDGHAHLNYQYVDSSTSQTKTNYSTIHAELDQTFTYSELSSPNIDCSRRGEIQLKDGSTEKVSIIPSGEYDSPDVGNRAVTLDMNSRSLTYTLYELGENGKWYTINITNYYLQDIRSNNKCYFTIKDLTELTDVNDTACTKTYAASNTFNVANGYTIENNPSCLVKIIKASAPRFAMDSELSLYFEYTGEAIDYLIGGLDSEVFSHVVLITDELNESFPASEFRQNITIALLTEIINVNVNGYTAQFSVTYSGNQFPNTSSTLSITVYVTPVNLRVTKVIKEYDNSTDTTNAVFKMTGFMGSDKLSTMGAVSGTYATKNVGKDINVTMATRSVSIGGRSYDLIFDNYSLSKKIWNVGIITPLEAEIINAYKNYDGTKGVSLTGDNATHILIKSNGTVVNSDIRHTNYEFTSALVGTCGFTVTGLATFSYVDENGSTVTKYVFRNGSNFSNYALKNASSASYTTANVGTILPKEITVSYVEKVYDGNTSIGSFVTSGQINENFTDFEGAYATENVVYANGKYNNAYAEGVLYSLTINNGTTTSQVTGYTLKRNGKGTNYVLSTSGEAVTLAGGRYTLTGIGVIIPAEVTITNVTKYYDNSANFDTKKIYDANDELIFATLNFNGTVINNYIFTGSMSSKDAGTGYDVTVDTTNFVYNGTTYKWLYNANNGAKNNYCVANQTFAKVGNILRLTLKVDSGSSSGSISDIYFSTTGGNKYVSNVHYTTANKTYEAIYDKNIAYKTDNFNAKLYIGTSSFNIRNGTCSTTDFGTLTFTLKVIYKDSNEVALQDSGEARNAGVYTFEISLASATNFTLDTSNHNNEFSFGIDKKSIQASNMKIQVANVSKVYDGTNIISTTIPKATSVKAELDNGDIINNNDWEKKTFGDITITAGSQCINAGIYSQGNGANNIIISEQITCESENYKFNGAVTNVFNNSTYSSKTTLTITPRPLDVPRQAVKAFDGSNEVKTTISTGIKTDVVEVTYTYAISQGGLNLLPGSYSVSANVSIDSANYTTNETTSLAMEILPAKIMLERQFINNQLGVNYFGVAFTIVNLKSLDFLGAFNNALTSTVLDDVLLNGIGASADSINIFKETISSLFVFSYNDSSLSSMNNVQIASIRVIAIEDEKALEIIFKGENTLDKETATDRYTAYMKGVEEVENVLTLSNSVYGSNVAISSSELADGQFDRLSYVTSGTEIANADDLVTFISEGSGVGYLTSNIYGFDASLVDNITFNATLNGNGYSIELSKGMATVGNNIGFFIAKNAGTIKDVNFKFISDVEIDAQSSIVGLAIGNNTGTISNCSIDIGYAPKLKAETSANIGGLVGESSGVIEHSTVTIAKDIDIGTFAGLAYQITNGSVSYVTARNVFACTSIASGSYALVNSSSISINYVINAISNSAAFVGAGVTLNNVYGVNGTELSIYDNTYTNGYVDYYFTRDSKFTTIDSGVVTLHNEYNQLGSNNINTTYYYGYSASNAGIYMVAIEVLAPLNRFIWEAFDAYYTRYSTNLNRAVGLYALSQDLGDASDALLLNTQGATIFTPVIGKVVTTVISAGTDTIKEYEYTGSRINATFEATSSEGDQISLVISGTDVGIYTEYYEEVSGEEETHEVNNWDIDGFSAQIITNSSGVGEARIMLIIVPRQLTTTPTVTKQYDSTNVAETVLANSVYAVGTYSSSDVGTGYEVKYNSTSKPVAAYKSGSTYYFVTYYLAGVDKDTEKNIYNIEYVKIDGTPFTNNTNISSLTTAKFARAYYQLVTLNQLTALVNDTENSIVRWDNVGASSISDLISVYVYDVTLDRIKDVNDGSVIWGNTIYNSTTLYNIKNRNEVATVNRNYTYKTSNSVFSVASNSIFDSETTASTREFTVTSNGGSITKRTIEATYSNLEQSYRKELTPISVEIANVSSLTNIPYSLTQDEVDDLIDYINGQIGSASLSGNILDQLLDGADIIKVDNKYYAAEQKYKEIEISGDSNQVFDLVGNDNLAVVISENATLILRYFEKQGDKFVIDSIEALLMLDVIESQEIDEGVYIYSDYQTLDYIITKNINGKGKVITSFINQFEGTIDGQNKIIKNFTLLGDSTTGLFSSISANAVIENIIFKDIVVVAKENDAIMSVVVAHNNGSISNIEVKAIYASDNDFTINPISGSLETGSAQTDCKAYIEVAKAPTSYTATNVDMIVILRNYNTKVVEFYLNGTKKDYADLSNNQKSIISELHINSPITLSSVVVQVNNFREYWAWMNICPWIENSNPSNNFIGYEFERVITSYQS